MPARRCTKIICTLGPATDDDDVLAQLVEQGMDAARLNLSFGTVEENLARFERLRRVSAQVGRPVGLIADLPGPKVRLGRIQDGRCDLTTGAEVVFAAREGVGDHETLYVDEGFFHDDMITGDKVLLSGGIVELEIVTVRDGEVVARVTCGGEIVERTAVHLPAVFLREGPIPARDEALLRLAVEHGADFIALTYVRNGADLLNAREKIEALGRPVPIIAKIDRHEAVSRLEAVLSRADAVMIRRGDLGANIELTRVPAVQKSVVRRANAEGVPAIIATQMLGSMTSASRPTRAEASDVSNAVVDGADGLMLSAETAIGRHPVTALSMMSRIIAETERELRARPDTDQAHLQSGLQKPRAGGRLDFADTTASIAYEAAARSGAAVIACFTESGRTASLVAKYRPTAPLIAFCHQEAPRLRLALTWGVETVPMTHVHEVEQMVQAVEARLVETEQVRAGDRVVIVFGAPFGVSGSTNSIRLHTIGR